MTYDLHVHTHLSSCADRQAFFHRYIPLAEKLGQTVLGFADHSWAEGVAGGSPWYQRQPYARLKEQKRALEAYLEEHPTSVKVLQGAEGEYANFLLGLDEAAAEYAEVIGLTLTEAQVGMPIAVANAVAQVKKEALYITAARGGEGAVREAIEFLLAARMDGRNPADYWTAATGPATI